MIKILFICHGNICRSPMAEFIMKDLVKKQGLDNEFEITSAATSTEEIGNDIYPPAKACLSCHGVPYTRHASTRIKESDLSYYDYIIAMEDYNIQNLKRVVGDSNKYSLLLDYTDIPGNISDPWYSGDFEKAYNEINKGCIGLINKLTK